MHLTSRNPQRPLRLSTLAKQRLPEDLLRTLCGPGVAVILWQDTCGSRDPGRVWVGGGGGGRILQIARGGNAPLQCSIVCLTSKDTGLDAKR